MFDLRYKRMRDFGDWRSLWCRVGNGSRRCSLVHGYPQNHVMWHKVRAAAFAQRFTSIAPDLRGYGASGKRPLDAEHLLLFKRAIAIDLIDGDDCVLASIAFDIVGHDRSARVTYRLAPTSLSCVRHAAVLDIVRPSSNSSDGAA